MSCQRSHAAITVRPWTPGDAIALHAAVRESIPSLSYWLPWCHPGYSQVDADAWIRHCQCAWENRSEFPFAIIGREGRVVGGTGLNKIDPSVRSANLGYWVSETCRGQGVATTAAALTVAMAFEELDLRQLEIVVLPHNLASRKVAERLGAKAEGLSPNRLIFHGNPADALVYRLVADDVDRTGPAIPS